MVSAKPYLYLFLKFSLFFVPSARGRQKVNDLQTGRMRMSYFNQKLDHYSKDTQYFTQRYYVYDNPNYIPGNPVYLLIGGRDELRHLEMDKRIWKNFAKVSHGLLIGLEHRMYGYSYSENDREHTMDNLVYLNTKQALADLAFFINDLSTYNRIGIVIPPDTKWVALGTSYGGTLAALLRSEYPDRIAAAVAIDAPLLATVEYKDFYNIVENQYIKEKVGETIKDAFEELEKGFNSCEKKHKRSKRNRLKCVKNQIIYEYKEIFKLCNYRLSKAYDLKDYKSFLFWSLTTILGRALQLKDSVRNDVINILSNKMKRPNALYRLGAAVKHVLVIEQAGCLITDYSSLIDSYKDTSISAETNLHYILKFGLGYRTSLYQHCSEWGQFETADKNDGIFANKIPLDFYMNICKRVFEKNFSANYLENATKRINKKYGGRDIDVSQVLFILHKNNFWMNLSFKSKILFDEDETMNAKEWNFVYGILKNWLQLENTGINDVSKKRGQVSRPAYKQGQVSRPKRNRVIEANKN